MQESINSIIESKKQQEQILENNHKKLNNFSLSRRRNSSNTSNHSNLDSSNYPHHVISHRPPSPSINTNSKCLSLNQPSVSPFAPSINKVDTYTNGTLDLSTNNYTNHTSISNLKEDIPTLYSTKSHNSSNQNYHRVSLHSTQGSPSPRPHKRHSKLTTKSSKLQRSSTVDETAEFHTPLGTDNMTTSPKSVNSSSENYTLSVIRRDQKAHSTSNATASKLTLPHHKTIKTNLIETSKSSFQKFFKHRSSHKSSASSKNQHHSPPRSPSKLSSINDESCFEEEDDLFERPNSTNHKTNHDIFSDMTSNKSQTINKEDLNNTIPNHKTEQPCLATPSDDYEYHHHPERNSSSGYKDTMDREGTLEQSQEHQQNQNAIKLNFPPPPSDSKENMLEKDLKTNIEGPPSEHYTVKANLGHNSISTSSLSSISSHQAKSYTAKISPKPYVNNELCNPFKKVNQTSSQQQAEQNQQQNLEETFKVRSRSFFREKTTTESIAKTESVYAKPDPTLNELNIDFIQKEENTNNTSSKPTKKSKKHDREHKTKHQDRGDYIEDNFTGPLKIKERVIKDKDTSSHTARKSGSPKTKHSPKSERARNSRRQTQLMYRKKHQNNNSHDADLEENDDDSDVETNFTERKMKKNDQIKYEKFNYELAHQKILGILNNGSVNVNNEFTSIPTKQLLDIKLNIQEAHKALYAANKIEEQAKKAPILQSEILNLNDKIFNLQRKLEIANNELAKYHNLAMNASLHLDDFDDPANLLINPENIKNDIENVLEETVKNTSPNHTTERGFHTSRNYSQNLLGFTASKVDIKPTPPNKLKLTNSNPQNNSKNVNLNNFNEFLYPEMHQTKSGHLFIDETPTKFLDIRKKFENLIAKNIKDKESKEALRLKLVGSSFNNPNGFYLTSSGSIDFCPDKTKLTDFNRSKSNLEGGDLLKIQNFVKSQQNQKQVKGGNLIRIFLLIKQIF